MAEPDLSAGMDAAGSNATHLLEWGYCEEGTEWRPSAGSTPWKQSLTGGSGCRRMPAWSSGWSSMERGRMPDATGDCGQERTDVSVVEALARGLAVFLADLLEDPEAW